MKKGWGKNFHFRALSLILPLMDVPIYISVIIAGLSWFVPLKPSEPWRKPLKERQAFSVRQEPWEPKSVPQSTWKNIVHGDVLKDKSDISNVSRDTKFDLDTTGQPIRDEESMSESDESDEEIGQSKSLSKMTLQVCYYFPTFLICHLSDSYLIAVFLHFCLHFSFPDYLIHL